MDIDNNIAQSLSSEMDRVSIGNTSEVNSYTVFFKYLFIFILCRFSRKFLKNLKKCSTFPFFTLFIVAQILFQLEITRTRQPGFLPIAINLSTFSLFAFYVGLCKHNTLIHLSMLLIFYYLCLFI